MIGRLVATLALMAAVGAAADGLSPLSVCEVIAKRIEYDRQILEVRGNVTAGGHGIYLEPSSKCSHELVTKGVVWPNIVNLIFPNNRSPLVDQHAPFELDQQALHAAETYAARVGYRPEVDVKVATYVGLFVTYPDLDSRVSPGVPGALRLGFGPAGLGAPAQLVIRTVKDVSIIRGGPRPGK
jgi:hypothetical protein